MGGFGRASWLYLLFPLVGKGGRKRLRLIYVAGDVGELVLCACLKMAFGFFSLRAGGISPVLLGNV